MSTEDVMQEHEVKRYFEIWRESVIRSRLTFTAVFLKLAHPSQGTTTHNQMTTFLQLKIRKTDLLFQLADGEYWGIFFLQSSDVEAKAFLNRIFAILKEEKEFKHITLKASITEIRNNNVNFDTLIAKNKQRLADNELSTWSIVQVEDYREQPNEQVKVSILEQNPIFRKVLESTLNQLDIPDFYISSNCL